MRTKKALWIGVACLACSVAAGAGDVWKDKTYKEWTEADVNRILTDSPWARPITTIATWRGTGKALADGVAQRTGDAGAPGERSGGIGTEVTNAINNDVGGAKPVEDTEARFILRWGSARTAREALARVAVLRGAPEAEADRILRQPITEHQFVLYGADMQPFSKSDEMSLMQKTSLKLKTHKTKVSPSRVEIKHSPDGKKISGVVFYFPLKTESGEPADRARRRAVHSTSLSTPRPSANRARDRRSRSRRRCERRRCGRAPPPSRR